MKQETFYKKESKEIHLDLYVDESKNRKYEIGETKEIIDYIMIMAIPLEKKEYLYKKLNNSRCLRNEGRIFENCNLKCKFHTENNGEIHYTKIQKENVKYKIANNWIDILLHNNLNDEKSIYFNILGVIESNLDMDLFGDDKQYGNVYTRFFRTALLRLIAVFNNYDRIIIEHIYHDSTTEMETHKYFDTNAIKHIRMRQFLQRENRIFFITDKVEFIDSDHKQGEQMNSQFIQFVDLVLGLTCNVIHNDAENAAKIKLTEKIYPLIKRVLDKKQYLNKNSKYNYFNKQIISFFPCVSKEKLKIKCNELYGNNFEIDNILKNGNFFINTKQLLFKIEDGQMSLFD